MKTFIYCIERIKTGKKYIGQHRGNINDNYWGSGRAISESIKKHGLDKFKKYILEYCSEDDVNMKEQYYISKYDTFIGEGYNMDDGGKCNNGYWKNLSEEKKKEIHSRRLLNRPKDFKERCKKAAELRDSTIISNKLKGRVYSKETLKKMSESAKKRGVPLPQLEKAWDAKRGSKLTDEQKSNISKGNKGKSKIRTKEHNEKIRQAALSRTEEQKSKLRKPVIQLDKEGNVIKKWKGVSFAGKALNIDYSCISNVCNGKGKTSGGFKWEWVKK